MIRLSVLLLSCVLLQAQTASFPTAVVSDAELLTGVKDRAESTLTGAINSSTLSIPVANGGAFAGDMLVTIENEQIKICSVSSNTLVVCADGRGFASTSAASHASGRTVRGQVGAYYYKKVARELQAVQTFLHDYIQGGVQVSDDILGVPDTDDVYARLFVRDTAIRTGRHVSFAITQDGCNALPTAADACTQSSTVGSGDKIGLFVFNQPGLARTTTLTAGINSSTLTIPLASVNIVDPTLQSNYPVRIKVDDEEMQVCSISGSSLIVCAGGRGFFSTTAASHSNGATVYSVADGWVTNFMFFKRPDIGVDVNMTVLELNPNNNFEDYTGTAGQRASAGLIIASAGYFKPSHGIYINTSGPFADDIGYFLPVLIENNSQRGIFVSNRNNTLDLVNTSANFAGKQLVDGGTVFFAQRASDSSPTGYAFQFLKLDGTPLAYMDANANMVTSGYYQAQGGSPDFRWYEGDAGTDLKMWRVVADGNSLRFGASNDAVSTFNEFMEVTRLLDAPLRTNIKTLFNLSTTPSYANNAAAVLGGLLAGDVYFVTGSNPGQLAVRY